jgi:hypothetical protein
METTSTTPAARAAGGRKRGARKSAAKTTTVETGNANAMPVSANAVPTSRVAFETKTYALGPQTDGSVVLQIRDDFDLMILRKAIEKQEKNTTAALGTVGAIAEGDDPLLGRCLGALSRLKSVVARARAPENQIADTPIGKALAQAQQEAAKPAAERDAEQVDGEEDGIVWSAHVPKPRPRIGQLIRHPSGAGTSIIAAIGYTDAGFEVLGADNAHYYVFAHEAPGGVEWRLRGAGTNAYAAPNTNVPNTKPVDTLTADAPDVDDGDESGMAGDMAAMTRVEQTVDALVRDTASDAQIADAIEQAHAAPTSRDMSPDERRIALEPEPDAAPIADMEFVAGYMPSAENGNDRLRGEPVPNAPAEPTKAEKAEKPAAKTAPGKPAAKAAAKKAAPALTQRERNARTAGVKRGVALPSQSAANKRGKGKH